MRKRPDETPSPAPAERETVELTPEELDQVVGGLAREWHLEDQPGDETPTTRFHPDLFGATLAV